MFAWARNIPRLSILRELAAGNAGDEAGRLRMRSFIKAAQRISFDGDHTLTVVCMSKREAAVWDEESFKLRGRTLQLNAIGEQAPGICSLPLLARHYALRVLGTEGSTLCFSCRCSRTSLRCQYSMSDTQGWPGYGWRAMITGWSYLPPEPAPPRFKSHVTDY